MVLSGSPLSRASVGLSLNQMLLDIVPSSTKQLPKQMPKELREISLKGRAAVPTSGVLAACSVLD